MAGFGVDATKILAEWQLSQARPATAAQTIAGMFEKETFDETTTLNLLGFLLGCSAQAQALELCERAIARSGKSSALHTIAGQLCSTLGRFEQARQHFEAAFEGSNTVNDCYLLFIMSRLQRYTDPGHADISRCRQQLKNLQLAPRERSNVLFALGKAYDDLRDFPAAATALREANAAMQSQTRWTAAAWRDSVEARIQAPPRPRLSPRGPEDGHDFTPVFIVGLPRSGTTLLADRLGRHPQVRDRQETYLIGKLDTMAKDSGRGNDREMLQDLARIANAHIRLDDAPAQVYLDKNPLNLTELGLIDAILPRARIIHCKRDLRDTALSIWCENFAQVDNYGFSFSFSDIAQVAVDCGRLMEHWRNTLALPIHTVQYEDFVARPEQNLREIERFLDLPPVDALAEAEPKESAISTASLWQVRQPIHQNSRGRWASYEPYIRDLAGPILEIG
jgi:tetratricopeptide (TPR) repeat protein